MVEILEYIGVAFFVILTAVSLYVNYFLFRRLLFFNENINVILDSMAEFIKHLDQIHELQMYYGDENLKNLILHSRDLKLELVEFSGAYAEQQTETKATKTKED
jgi:tRNA A-37 threonylcarbamoyl transferase component Bud32